VSFWSKDKIVLECWITVKCLETRHNVPIVEFGFLAPDVVCLREERWATRQIIDDVVQLLNCAEG